MVRRPSQSNERSVARYVIRVVGGAGLSHSRLGSTRDLHAGASLAVRKRPLSPWRPATPLSDGPPPLRPRRSWPPAVPSDDRRGFGRVPSLLLGAPACSATARAGTPPSADLL